ncbi:hypothetical protein SISSUDRAFT_262780 [Sistotremastrum suecicum HHB10207 ss-3]|uniref:Uncharacterized protein n=1 Tax=Sistotremastrum suecicum HHB10207 ss-3 TaxID=1314776 RepID=A0A166GEL5_9AGAM|nr:hypothetical protein SISSUDRAFT_262780 [Sistotremastrum suecicum HHB10207 ss-3]
MNAPVERERINQIMSEQPWPMAHKRSSDEHPVTTGNDRDHIFLPYWAKTMFQAELNMNLSDFFTSWEIQGRGDLTRIPFQFQTKSRCSLCVDRLYVILPVCFRCDDADVNNCCGRILVVSLNIVTICLRFRLLPPSNENNSLSCVRAVTQVSTLLTRDVYNSVSLVSPFYSSVM